MSAAAAALILAATASVAAATATPAGVDAGFELLVTTAGTATPRTCFRTGIPNFVDGTFLIAGPARFEIGQYKFQAIFDGFGKMNKFELREGEVCYTSAWMETGYYSESLRENQPAPTILFEETQPPRPNCLNPMCNMLGPNDNNWVNVIPVGDEVLLLTDSVRMLSMDLETLNCSRHKVWADDKPYPTGPAPDWLLGWHAGSGGSAHPLKIPGTETWVEILDEMPMGLGNSWLDVYTFSGSASGPQRRTKIGSIQTSGDRYIHSFGVTPDHVVLTYNYKMQVNPLNFNILLGNIQGDWQGIHVMDYSGRWQAFATHPFFHVHTVNTFENASGIVMDVGFYKQLPFGKIPALDIGLFLNKTARDAGTARSGIRRLHLHTSGPARGTVTYEDLVPISRSLDFFQVNPAYQGRPYCIYYAVEWWHDDASYASMAVLKHDVCRGAKAYWSRADTYMGEPTFIGRHGGGAGADGTEDDGVLVFVALDGRGRRSELVTLDARTLGEVSVVALPGHIPFTAHGHFIPTGARASQQTVLV